MARRILRYLVLVVAVALIGCVLPAVAESVKDMPMPTAYVNDYAGVLNDSTKSDLNNQLHALETQAHAQMFVAVIHKIEGADSPAEFANQLFAKWKPGQKGQDRGLVLVVAVDDHKYQFEVGYGLEGILPDGKTGDIGRDMVPDLKTANYDGAVRTAVGEVSDVVAKDAGVTLATAQPVHTYHREQRRSGSPIPGILIFLAILFFIFLASRGGRGGGGRFGGGGGGGFWTGILLGNLLGGGGRRGGWGDDDSGWGGGGGGGWGGGGGGGFSGGGGGSSGGGGAGGSW